MNDNLYFVLALLLGWGMPFLLYLAFLHLRHSVRILLWPRYRRRAFERLADKGFFVMNREAFDEFEKRLRENYFRL